MVKKKHKKRPKKPNVSDGVLRSMSYKVTPFSFRLYQPGLGLSQLFGLVKASSGGHYLSLLTDITIIERLLKVKTATIY